MTIYSHLYKKNVVSISRNIFLLHLSLYLAKDLLILLFPKVLNPIITKNRFITFMLAIYVNREKIFLVFSQVSMIMHLFKYRWRKTYVYAKMYLLDISFLLLVIISHLFRKFNSIPCKMESMLP